MTFLGESSIDVLGVLEKFRAEFPTMVGLTFLLLYWLRWRFSLPTCEFCVLLVTSGGSIELGTVKELPTLLAVCKEFSLCLPIGNF